MPASRVRGRPPVIVVGLDCVPPRLAFDLYRDAMPNLTRLCAGGAYGPLRSTMPPITVPAWVSMTSGRDPGELGLYGFRNRVPGTYGMTMPRSQDVPVKRIWEHLGEAGLSVASLFVPLTYPVRGVRGTMVSDFLTPDGAVDFAWPPSMGEALRARFGPYASDVADFRTEDRARVLNDIRAMTAQHFDIACHVLEAERPDFLMLVEMGPDRLHHAFYHFIDPDHPRFEPASPFVEACRAYYAYLDQRLGDLVSTAGDDALILVVSDHGAKPLEAGFRINQWLVDEGYLVLEGKPGQPARREGPLDPAAILWDRTRAVGEGGYYARIFLNVEGRDPEGIIPAARYEWERDALAERLRGAARDARIEYPERIYRQCRGAPPDLMVFFDDLRVRALGSVGGEGLYRSANDTGPDSCNHDWDGIFVLFDPARPARGRVPIRDIRAVARTVGEAAGVPMPEAMYRPSLYADDVTSKVS